MSVYTMNASSILHTTALVNTFDINIKPKRRIKLIRDVAEQPPRKRRIILMRESEKEKAMPPRKKANTLEPIQEKVTMVHVNMLEKKMPIVPVDDVEVVRLVLFQHGGKSYYRDAAKNKLYACNGPKSVGSYLGRWDPLEQTIRADISDSDTE